ncbi:MAG: aryl-sulfate sulfotransferase [Gemmatimonadaceae bacterium]|nr:aryl-sulfate sulfotransferase [Gemmatimonadaceae bacterium]
MKTLPFKLCAPLAFSVLLSSCEDPADPLPSGVLSVSIDSSAGPITRFATITLERPAPVRVTYGATGTPVLTITADSNAAVHRIWLPRLRAGSEYTIEAGVPADGGVHVAEFGTGSLPADVAEIELEEIGTPTAPVALVEIASAGAPPGGFTGLLMVERGEVVGYIRVPGALFGSTRRANGEIVVVHPTFGLMRHRPDGSVIDQLTQPPLGVTYRRIHHDVTATPSNTLLFIANDTLTIDGTHVIGESLWEWTPETGAVVKRWSSFDHLDWRTERGPPGSRSVPGNWLHGNGIKYGPRGNVVMSLRNISQVISISPDFSTVEWRLGGASPTIPLTEAERFFGQHYVSEPALNRILVYDNGFARPGCATHTDAACFTRAVEYEINPVAKTATQKWEYRHSPNKIYADLVGSAIRLSNGNTVVLFGMFGPGEPNVPSPLSSGPRTAVEVNEAGAVRWRLNFLSDNPTRIYRVTPAASLVGEQIQFPSD